MTQTATIIQLPDGFSEMVANKVTANLKEQFQSRPEYPAYFNVKEAATYLGVSFNTLKKWMRMYPEFPVKEIDGSYHINRKQLDKFMTNM